MKKKRILVINCGWEQEPLLRELQKRSLEIIGIHYDENYSRAVEYSAIYQMNLRDIEAAHRIAKEHQIDAVISDQCDYSHFLQAVIAEELHLPGPNLEAAQISSNKWLQRNRAKELRFRVPQFQLCYLKSEVENFMKKVNTAIILKPIDNRGSFGVSKVSDKTEIPAAFQKALFESHSRCVLAEEFIEGIEITVDGYCFNGNVRSLALASKRKIGGAHQVAMDIKYPAELPEETQIQIKNYNQKLNQALGYQFGMTHTEYILSNQNELYLIESANRGGGVFTSEIIVPQVSGVDLVKIYVNDVLNEESSESLPETLASNEVTLKFFGLNHGKVNKIMGTQLISEDPDVLAFRMNVSEGDEIKEISNDACRHGFVIVKGDRNKAENVMSRLQVSYVKE